MPRGEDATFTAEDEDPVDPFHQVVQPVIDDQDRAIRAPGGQQRMKAARRRG